MALVEDIRIDGPADPRVADYLIVTEPALVGRRGLFVAEGRLVVQRLIQDRRYLIRSLLVNDAARKALDPVLGDLNPGTPVYLADAVHFHAITGYDVHRGCLALAERGAERLAADLLRTARLVVVLEGVTNADNVGGVFRNAAAFGADAVLLDPASCDPLYRKAIRTSMATTLRVPFARLPGWPASLAEIGAAGLALVALTPRGPSVSLDELAASLRAGRIALVIGSEGEGLSPAVEALADHRVSIPIRAAVDSLNLSVAAGIALSRLTCRADLA